VTQSIPKIIRGQKYPYYMPQGWAKVIHNAKKKSSYFCGENHVRQLS
jgi:hypothetical protein